MARPSMKGSGADAGGNIGAGVGGLVVSRGLGSDVGDLVVGLGVGSSDGAFVVGSGVGDLGVG